jgi:hypothetical protein
VPLGWSWASAPSGWTPTGDSAVLTLRARDVFTRHSPLVGMPTTLSATAGEQLHHPGPSELWAVAVAEAATDRADAPLLAMVVVHALALVAVVVLVAATGGPAAAVLTAAGAFGVLWSLRGDVLVDPWNPWAGLLPLAAALVAVAVAAGGGSRWALPVAVAAGSWAAQAHLAYLPITGAAAVAGLAWWAVAGRRRRTGAFDRARSWWRAPPVLVTVVVAAVLWAPVALDLLVGSRNLLRLVGAPGAAEEVLGLSAAAHALVNAVAPPPLWAAAPVALQLLEPPGPVATALAAAAGVAALVGVVAHRRRHPVVAAALVVALAVLGAGTVLVSQLPATTFNVAATHNYLWLWPASALLWGGLVAAVVVALVDAGLAPAPVVAGILLALASLAVVVTDPLTLRLSARVVPVAAPAVDRAVAAVDPAGRYRVEIGGDAFGAGPVATALLLGLERAGIEAHVDEEVHRASYGDHRMLRGRPVDGTLLVRSGRQPPEPPPGARVMAEVAPSTADLSRLRDVHDEVVDHVEAADDARLHPEDRPLTADDARRLLDDHAFLASLLLGTVEAPSLPRSTIDRLHDAEEGRVLSHLRVFLLPEEAPS